MSSLAGAAGRRLRSIDLRDYVVYLGFAAILVFFSIILFDKGFLTPANLLNIVRQSATIVVMSVGMVYVLSAAEIDLSIGSVVALSAVTTALLLPTSVPLAIAAGFGVGIIVGTINGVLTTGLRLPSFLVTLGTMTIASGIARTVSNVESIPVANVGFQDVFGAGEFGPISTIFVWPAIVVILGHIVYRHAPFGRHVLAVGGNRIAARFSGINANRVKLSVFVISASCAALAGLLYAGRLHGARYSLGETDLFTVIAAVVLGGTSLFGGRGSIVGAVVGALTMAMLNNGLILLGLSVSQQLIARGLIILVAVALSLRERETA